MVSYYVEQMTKMRSQPLKSKLSSTDYDQIIAAFGCRIAKITSKLVVIKDSKYGYELFKSQQDDKYWAYAVTFEEPIDPISPKYKHHWMGNAIVGYGFTELSETIDKVKALMVSGPTCTPPIRDYLCDWDEEHDRIVLDWDKYMLDYETYFNFYKWFTKNKIRIMVKNKNIKDAEDYGKEPQTGLSVLMAKTQEPPKRPRQMVTVFVESDVKLTKVDDNTKKSYIIGFLYT